MEFNSKRFLKLAGLPDAEPVAQVRPSPRPLTESARRSPAMSADEQKLRSLIRREAQRMISERATRTANPSVAAIQQKKSLTEAITMGFAGFGFGGKSPVLGGPMTSTSRFASLSEAEKDIEELDETDAFDDAEGTLEMDDPEKGEED